MQASIVNSPVHPSPPGRPSSVGKGAVLDLAFLDRQTLGDLALREEVLLLFLDQADDFRSRLLGGADPGARLALAHGLRGAARSLGACALAEGLADLELDPADEFKGRAVLALLDELRPAIERLLPAAAAPSQG